EAEGGEVHEERAKNVESGPSEARRYQDGTELGSLASESRSGPDGVRGLWSAVPRRRFGRAGSTARFCADQSPTRRTAEDVRLKAVSRHRTQNIQTLRPYRPPSLSS